MVSMEQLIHEALPFLAKELEYRVEKITSLDFFYTDGTACGSFLKLVLERKDSSTSLYFYPSATYWSSGFMTEEEKRIVNGWLETVKSRKFESDILKQSLCQPATATITE
jgi:hypothetical protein